MIYQKFKIIKYFPSSNGVSADDDEWDYSDRLVDPNKPGVPVRALYDYEGVEGDELSFSIGEEFLFLSI